MQDVQFLQRQVLKRAVQRQYVSRSIRYYFSPKLSSHCSSETFLHFSYSTALLYFLLNKYIICIWKFLTKSGLASTAQLSILLFDKIVSFALIITFHLCSTSTFTSNSTSRFRVYRMESSTTDESNSTKHIEFFLKLKQR